MANLPQYTRVPNNVEMSPLWKKDSATIDIEAQLPPVGQRVEVKFTFVPRWPMKGSRQNVISILGATKQATTHIIQKAFPVLADLHPDRVQFLAPLGPEASEDNWAVIMDEAWTRFRDAPPKQLLVQVRDEPGDNDARAVHKDYVHFRNTMLDSVVPPTAIVLVGALGLFLLVCLIRLLIYGFSPAQAVSPSTIPSTNATAQ